MPVPELLGVSLIVLAALASSKAHGQTSQPAMTTTATLSREHAPAPATTTPTIAVPGNVAVAPIVRPPLPRGRPVAAPPLPVANSREDICNTLAASANKHGLPVAFFGNLIYQESGLKPRVVSHAGARGIAQFMPGTARMVGLKNPFNPREALPASAKFLRSLLHQFDNNYGLAAAAYNAGPGKVSRWLKRRTVLPKETRDYVKTITGQQAEHWRGIRGNRFGHRLAQRMPCNSMTSFARINDPVFLEKDMVRKALAMLPRPGSQQVAKIAAVSPVASDAIATPATSATATDNAPQKHDERPAGVNTPTMVASAINMQLPRTSSSEQPTGAVTTVMKSEPAATAAPKPVQAAALTSPTEKPGIKADTKKAKAKKIESRKAEAKLAEKKKAEKKKAKAKKIADKKSGVKKARQS